MKEKKIQVLNEFKLGCCIRQISKFEVRKLNPAKNQKTKMEFS